MRRKTALHVIVTILGLSLIYAAWLILGDSSPSEGQVSYLLAWDWDKVQVTQKGWQTTTNLGYAVEMTTGYLVAHEAQMNPCTHSHGLFDWLKNMGAMPVYAGHGGDSNDSTIQVSLIENLIDPQTQRWGTATIYEPTYCEAFYLAARGESNSLNSPDDVSMYGTSVYLEGTYIVPGTTEPIDFVFQTGQANGVLKEFTADGVSVHVALSDRPLEIAITRSLGTLLDEIDFDRMNADDAAFQVLRNIVSNTTFEVLSGQIHANA